MEQRMDRKWLALAGLLFYAVSSTAQVSQLNNNIVLPLPYIGCDALSTQPLRLTTTLNFNIDFRTVDLLRMRLNGNQTSAINGYLLNAQNGFVGISGRPGFFDPLINPGPFSRLHLVDNTGAASPTVYAQQFGYRPWMRNGVTFTGNSDQSYIGQQYMGADATDMVIQWSDNPQTDPWASDRMRFVFASNPVPPATTGMRSLNGLEAMRLWPNSATSVNVGIGDWLVAGSGDPTERLDLLTGKLRIRQLPSDPVSLSTELVTVNMTNGVLEHIAAAALPDNCEWAIVNNGVLNNVVTAYGPFDASCPDATDNVAIGDDGWALPGSKLAVFEISPVTGGTDVAISAITEGGAGVNYGIVADCNVAGTTFATENVGVSVTVKNATTTRGVAAYATVSSPATLVEGSHSYAGASAATTSLIGSNNFASTTASCGVVIAVNGEALCQGGTTTSSYGLRGTSTSTTGSITTGYGVYGSSSGAATNWAGYFSGDVNVTGAGFIPGGSWSASDAILKTNVQVLANGLDMISQLQPKTFDYLTTDFAMIGLPSGNQAGVMAQELELVLPQLVKETTVPAQYDSLGNETSAGFNYKAVNYEGLIPYLIGAVQEQQQQIADLQQEVAACCPLNDGPLMQPQGTGGIGYIDNTQRAANNTRQLNADELVVSPNPFNDNPTISYRIGTTGRAQLRISSASGRDMGVLFDAGTEAGQYSMVWNTVGMAPGLYLLTLTVDGNRVTEQAVKVD